MSVDLSALGESVALLRKDVPGRTFLPRLDDAASHEASIGLLVSIGMRLNKPWFRSDIVVEEQYDLVLRLKPRFMARGISGSGKCIHRIAAERSYSSRVRTTPGMRSLVWSKTSTSAGGGTRARTRRMVSIRTWSRP